MSDEVRVCPHCKGDAVTGDYDTEIDAWAITCTGCDARVVSRISSDDALERWNTRPIEDELRAELAQRGEWEAVEYNDCIYGDVGTVQIRIVKDYSAQDKGLYLHVQKRMMGEWAHVGLTKLPDNYRIQKRRKEVANDGE